MMIATPKLLVPIVLVALAALTGCIEINDVYQPLSEEEKRSRPAMHTVDFGDDESQWSEDGECDDPRFKGPGMTDTVLLEEDEKHDATDCRDQWQKGKLMMAD